MKSTKIPPVKAPPAKVPAAQASLGPSAKARPTGASARALQWPSATSEVLRPPPGLDILTPMKLLADSRQLLPAMDEPPAAPSQPTMASDLTTANDLAADMHRMLKELQSERDERKRLECLLTSIVTPPSP